MSSNVSINLYLRPCSIAIYGKFYLYCLYHLRLFCSVNCENLVCKLCITFGSVKIHTHCLYWNSFSTGINGKIIFNCLLLFKPLLLVSKLYESKLYEACSETEARGIFEGFSCNFPVLSLAFFHLVCKLLKPFFYSLFVGQ